MYAMYPEWGPAHHRTDDTSAGSAPRRRRRSWERDLVGAAAGTRDADDPRPDDN